MIFVYGTCPDKLWFILIEIEDHDMKKIVNEYSEEVNRSIHAFM